MMQIMMIWAVLDTFAINKTEVQEADKTALKIAVDLANAITDEDLTNVVPAVVDELSWLEMRLIQYIITQVLHKLK